MGEAGKEPRQGGNTMEKKKGKVVKVEGNEVYKQAHRSR